MTPINAGGYFHVAPGGSGWGQFTVPGAVLPTISGVPIPDLATGMLIQAVGATEFLLSPTTAVGGATGMQLAAGQFLWVPGRANIYQFVVDLGDNFCVQFYEGDDDTGPLISAESGGGGGGTITAVSASLPLASSGGTTPNIIIANGTADGQLIQWNGSSWTTLRQSKTAQITWVDSVYGVDATAQPNNPFRPYLTLQAAINAYASGVTFIICRGTANYTITAKLPPQNWRIDVPDGTLTNSYVGLWLSSSSTAVINAAVIGNFQAGDNSHFILNGSLTGTATVGYAAASLVINGDHIGNILTGVGPITINGNQVGTVTSSAATAVITIENGICGKVTGTNLKLNLTNVVVDAITGDDPAHPILVTAKNSTSSQIVENATMQSGSTGNYGFFQESITFPIGTVTDGTVRLVKFSQPTTFFKATVQSDTGTTTLAVNIGGTPITGLSAVAIGTSETSASATAANHAAIGDYLSFIFSSTASAKGVTITLYYQEIVP